MKDLVPDEATIVMITRDGYIKRLPPDTSKYPRPRRQGRDRFGDQGRGRGRTALYRPTRTPTFCSSPRRGRVFQLKAYEIPQGSRTAKGQAIVNFLQLAPGEKVANILPMTDIEGSKFLTMVTSQGTVKKTAIEDFEHVRRSGLIAITLHDGDDLKWVNPTSGKDDISLVTKKGQSIRFSEDDIRAMGRSAAGVRGIRLKKDDEVVGMDIVDPKLAAKGLFTLFTVAENGLGKQTNLDEYKTQGRGGSGIRTMKVTA